MEAFFGSPDDEEEKAEGFIGEVGLREYFCHIFLNLSHFALKLGV